MNLYSGDFQYQVATVKSSTSSDMRGVVASLPIAQIRRWYNDHKEINIHTVIISVRK